MATALGDIFVRIGLIAKDFEDGLNKVQTKSTKVFAGISAAIAGVSYIGAGFEKEITKVGALTGATGETFENLGRVARQVAKDTEFTASQAAEGMSFFAMAGFTAEQSMAALKPATVLATTGFTDLGRASDIVTNILSGFGKGLDELDHSIDVLVATATNSNTTINMLGESMSYMAPVARAFGISIEETSAAMGILGDAGIQGSRAGTNLRMAIVKLTKPGKEAAAILKNMGIQVLDARGKMKPLSEIFGKLAQKGATAQQMLTLFGPRAASAAMILTQSMRSSEKSLSSFTEKLKGADGTAQGIFDRMKETVTFQFNVMKSNFEEAALVLYDQLRPALIGIIQIFTMFAQVLAQLSPNTKALIVGITLATAALAGFALVSSTAALIGLKLVAALIWLATPFVALGGIIVAVATAIISYDYAAVIARVTTIANAIATKAYATAVVIMNTVVALATMRMSAFAIATAVASKILLVIKGIALFVAAGFGKIIGVFTALKAGIIYIGAGFLKLGVFIKAFAIGAGGVLKAIFLGLLSPVGLFIGAFVAMALSIANLIRVIIWNWDGLKFEFWQGVKWLLNILGLPGKYMLEVFDKTFAKIKGWFSDMLDTIFSALGAAGKWIQKLGGKALDLVGFGKSKDPTSIGAGSTGASDKGMIASVSDFVSSNVKKGLEYLGFSFDATAGQSDALSDALKGLNTPVKVLEENVAATGEAVADTAQMLVDAVAMGPAIPAGLTKYQTLLEGHLKDQNTYQTELKKKRENDLQVLDGLMQAEETARQEAIKKQQESTKTLGGLLTDNLTGIFAKATPVVTSIIDSFVGKLGKVGDLLNAGLQGFSMGGPIGAIIAVIAEILFSLDTFKTAVDMSNQGLNQIFRALSPVFQVLVTVSKVANQFLESILSVLRPILEILGRVIGGYFGLILKAISPILNGVTKLFGSLMTVIEPILSIFVQLFNIIGTFIDAISTFTEMTSPLGYIIEGIGAAAKELGKGFTEVANWFEGAARDIGKAFETATNEIKNSVFAQKVINEAYALTERSLAEIHKSMLSELEVRNRFITVLNGYNGTIHDFIEKLKQDMVLRDLTPEQIAKTFNEETATLSLDDTVSVMVEMYKQLTGAGLDHLEALKRISQGVDLSSTKTMVALTVLPSALYEAGNTIESAAEEVSGFGEAVAEATESLTNVPSGFKLVQKRLQAISDNFEAVQIAQPSPVHVPEDKLMRASNSSVLNINSVTVQADDPKVFMQKMEALKQQQNINTYGTSIGPSYGIAGNG